MKWLKFLIITVIFLSLTATPVYAVCPICTIAVGAGLGISRWLGIDDTVTGIWIGGLILSTSLWLADWLEHKSWKIPAKKLLSIILMFLLTFPPLYWLKIIGSSDNILWGIDKIILGTTVGSILFLASVYLDKFLRTTNDGKIYIYYQKVILPVFLLTLTSFIFYLITR